MTKDIKKSFLKELSRRFGPLHKNVWIPTADRKKLDWQLVEPFECHDALQYTIQSVKNILQEVDVIWFQRGFSKPRALFEVEHSTPIYSALLRFNDIYLSAPELKTRFNVVANDVRRDLFVRQLNRPTFRISGLSALCNFLDYKNVFGLYNRKKTK